MSWTPAPTPSCTEPGAGADIELMIEARTRDLGGFAVGRVLPSPRRRSVGPFLFFDEMGPVELSADHAVDVRPHPHINLATVTYLFAGEILHRDSLGSVQPIRPGAVNWMTAGRGIVHSERTPIDRRAGPMHGLQLWCGLPTADEEVEPAFDHYPADTLPSVGEHGLTIRVLAGDAFGVRSPVRTLSRLFYVDVVATAAAAIDVPDYPERGAYVVSGRVRRGDQAFDHGAMIVLAPGRAIRLELEPGTRIVMLGGDPLDGPRHIYWNFVSSSRDRIEQAKADWRARRFPIVPGDEVELIPLPED